MTILAASDGSARGTRSRTATEPRPTRWCWPGSEITYPAGSVSRPAAELPTRRAAMIPVIGARSVAQLEEALGALELELTAEDLAELDGL
jgi:hypothetical protein